MTLPTSYIIPSHLLDIEPDPFASGGFRDVYHGTFDGSRVLIEHVRTYTRFDPQKATKVRYSRRRSPRSPSLTKLAELLPRGCNLEEVGTPEHPPISRCYHRPPPAHFESRDRWEPAGIHQETPRCRPTRTRRRPSCCVYLTLIPITSYSTSPRASATSTLAVSFTETSREHVVFLNTVSSF